MLKLTIYEDKYIHGGYRYTLAVREYCDDTLIAGAAGVFSTENDAMTALSMFKQFTDDEYREKVIGEMLQQLEGENPDD